MKKSQLLQSIIIFILGSFFLIFLTSYLNIYLTETELTIIEILTIGTMILLIIGDGKY